MVRTVVPVTTTALYVLVLGVLGASVTGAIAVFLIGTAIQAIALLLYAVQAGRAARSSERPAIGRSSAMGCRPTLGA